MDNKTKYALIAAVLLGGYLMYRNINSTEGAADPTAAGGSMAPEVANSPLLPEVNGWIAQTGTTAGLWTAALNKFTLDELQKLHTMIYEVWPKYDPYKYYFDAAHTELAGNWFMALKAKYLIP